MSDRLWDDRSLGDIATLEYGAALPAAVRVGDEFPVFGSNGEVGRHRAALVGGPGIVVGRKGTVGALVWSSTDFWPIDTSYYVEVRRGVDKRWLYWAMLTLGLERLDSSTGVPGLNRNDAYELRLKVPRVKVQQKIAEILDVLDSQIRRTEDLIEKRRLQKTGLVDHFVSAANRVNLEIQSLGEVVNRYEGFIQTGPFGSQLHSSDYVDDGVPVVMPQDISEGRVNLDSIARVSEKMARSLARHRMLPGDVVFARRGDLGRCAEITAREQGWLCGTGCLLVRTPAAVLTAGWLALVYRHELGQRHVRANAVGSTMANLNSKILARMRLPVPPVPRQEEAISVIKAHDYETSLERRRLVKLYTLKSGLMADLLTGRVRVPEWIAS